jgi:hypothetical protein
VATLESFNVTFTACNDTAASLNSTAPLNFTGLNLSVQKDEIRALLVPILAVAIALSAISALYFRRHPPHCCGSGPNPV